MFLSWENILEVEKGGNFRREHKKKVEAGGGDTVVFEWYRVESCLVPVPLNSASIQSTIVVVQ